MALFSKLFGPKLNQLVVYSSSAGTNQAAIISGVNTDGTVSLAYFTAGSATLGAASNVKFDPTGVTTNPSWRWPEEYF
jgi:hypothetical protein